MFPTPGRVFAMFHVFFEHTRSSSCGEGCFLAAAYVVNATSAKLFSGLEFAVFDEEGGPFS